MLNFFVTKLSHYPHSYLLFVCLNNYLLFSTLLLLSQLYKNDDDDYVLCSLLLLMNFNAIVANNPIIIDTFITTVRLPSYREGHRLEKAYTFPLLFSSVYYSDFET